jgi:UDP-N-acetylmuramate--alanine ligase
MKVYFIGIKGVGMTALAQIFQAKGFDVVGSDVAEEFFTDQVLKDSGITFYSGFDIRHITPDLDLVVVSDAFLLTANEEVDEVKRLNLKLLSYSQALGELSKDFVTLGISGTHGKTTTTAMTGYVFERLEQDPYVLVGSMVPQFGGNARISTTNSNLLIAECDEYRDHFLNFLPSGGIAILNIEYDHPDYFADIEVYVKSFTQFLHKVPANGFVAYNYDDETARTLCEVEDIQCRRISFSMANEQAVVYLNPKHEVFVKGENIGKLEILLPGRHNLMNALASISMVYGYGLDVSKAIAYLKDFVGTKRRLEYKGQKSEILVFDDYAHHPTEIKASLLALKDKFVGYELVCMFQPHTFSRTQKLLDEFGLAFDGANKVVLLPIYASAREKTGHITSEVLLKKIRQSGYKSQNLVLMKDFGEAQEFLTHNLELNKKSVLVTMGAGDVWKVGENFLDNK